MSVHPSKLPLSALVNERLSGAECVFDPELHDGPDPRTTIEPVQDRAAREDVAKEICASCPVQTMCREYASRTRPERGVWAGRTAQETAVLAVTAQRVA
jgi:WhiB family redox-sensing transcriptional regulator